MSAIDRVEINWSDRQAVAKYIAELLGYDRDHDWKGRDEHGVPVYDTNVLDVADGFMAEHARLRAEIERLSSQINRDWLMVQTSEGPRRMRVVDIERESLRVENERLEAEREELRAWLEVEQTGRREREEAARRRVAPLPQKKWEWD